MRRSSIRMPSDWKWKLRAINAFCQSVFFINATLTLIISFGLTIPNYCHGDRDCMYTSKILAWYVFINMAVNYLCIIQKSKLSHVSKSLGSSERSKASLLLSPLNLGTSSSLSQVQLMNNNVDMGRSNGHSVDTPRSHMTHSEPSYSHQLTGQLNPMSEVKQHLPAQVLTTRQGVADYSESTPSLAGWVHCWPCDLMSPPRAKHCPLCNHCILKRDHHCFFAGCCVGFHNQKYFIAFCLHTGMGCMLSCFFLFIYLHQNYEAANVLGYLAYFPPFMPFLWLFGYTSLSFIGIILFGFFNLITCSAGLYYFAVQFFLIIRGQTKHECEKNIRIYKGTIRSNIRSVFGDFFPLNFLVPIPVSGYHGDGINWDEMLN